LGVYDCVRVGKHVFVNVFQMCCDCCNSLYYGTSVCLYEWYCVQCVA